MCRIEKEVVTLKIGICIKCEKVGPAYRYLCNSLDDRKLVHAPEHLRVHFLIVLPDQLLPTIM